VAGWVSAILTLNLTVMDGIGRMFRGRFGVFRTATRRHMSLRAVDRSAAVAPVAPVDLQQEGVARPRSLALPETDAAPANCRNGPDHARRIGRPAVFARMIGSCYSGELFAAFMEQGSAELHVTDDMPRRLGGGSLSNGMSAGV
jgi:hypothetical protein